MFNTHLILALISFSLCAVAQDAYAAPPLQTSVGSVYDFGRFSPYKRSVPSPSQVLGYEFCSRHTTYREQEIYLNRVASAASDRVRLVEYGKSVEGRPLHLAIVSSPENIKRLETIKSNIALLADPRKPKTLSEASIIRTTPAIVWINHCIHGNETASFESAMMTLYTLAASDSSEVKAMLNDAVVILNPVFNPDGHERFVVYFNSINVGSPESYAFEKEEPWAVYGRLNHYRFDMNRDKLAQSQQETRAETAALLQWNPQVYVDEHGQPEIYFFPPNPMAINRHADRARLNKWTSAFGKSNAAAFDKYGWQYVTKEAFDFFYPGYLDTFATLTGAIGMTYETDAGGSMARRRDDGVIITLRDATAHHFEATLATIRTAAAHSSALLEDFTNYKKSALADTEKSKMLVIVPESDGARANELVKLLRSVGIEVKAATVPFESTKAHSYLTPLAKETTQKFPAGSFIVDYTQPNGHLARAFLEADPDFEPEFVAQQKAKLAFNLKRNDAEPREGYDFYDVTGWALTYSYNMSAFWLEDRPVAITSQASAPLVAGITGEKDGVLYVIASTNENCSLAALHLQLKDVHLHVATKTIAVGGKTWPAGTILARSNRNEPNLRQLLETEAKVSGLQITAISSTYTESDLPGAGTESIVPLRTPSIAVAVDDGVSQTSYGAVWHLLETHGVPFAPVKISNLKSSGVNSRFNVIILPDGRGYESGLGKDGMEAMKKWVEAGGALVGLGDGGLWYMNKDAGMTTSTKVTSEDKAKKPISLSGAIFKAHLNRNDLLGWGYSNEDIPVPLSGSVFIKPTTKGTNVLTFGKASKLSGFVWEKNTEELLDGTVYAIDEPIGEGHAFVFLDDINFRGLWIGLNKMMFNAITYGPQRSVPSFTGR